MNGARSKGLAARVLSLIAMFSLLAASRALAQDANAQEEARRILEEARAHDEAGRFAMAAERYVALYESLRRASVERAPMALYSAGHSLAQLPGREQDARAHLQRFIDESTTLTSHADVRDRRSEALELIAELDARTSSATNTTRDAPDSVEPTPSRDGGISPVGPIVIGIGGAVVAAGLITGGVALAEDSNFSTLCPTRTDCPADSRSAYDQARTLAAVSDVMWIGGTLIAATGVILTIVLRDSGGDDSGVTAGCSAEGCALIVRSTF